MITTAVIVLTAITALAVLIFCSSFERRDIWSISVYSGSSPFALKPHPAIGNRPVLVAADVNDVAAGFVADPFLLRQDDRWLMFFEVFDNASKRGIIAVAVSEDGSAWRYDRVVLREPFHLSYPYVFESDGAMFMVPESADAGAVRLYRAQETPYVWKYECDLLRGTFYDSSLIRHQGLWWLFASDEQQCLRLFSARALQGPWVEHPCSPVVSRSDRISRAGGRLLLHHGTLFRFAQDGQPTYGSSVRVFRITHLSQDAYAEVELPGPILRGSGAGWNSTGMHHIDAVALAGGNEWIASVDGNRQRTTWNWRGGVRRTQRLLSGIVTRSL